MSKKGKSNKGATPQNAPQAARDAQAGSAQAGSDPVTGAQHGNAQAADSASVRNHIDAQAQVSREGERRVTQDVAKLFYQRVAVSDRRAPHAQFDPDFTQSDIDILDARFKKYGIDPATVTGSYKERLDYCNIQEDNEKSGMGEPEPSISDIGKNNKSKRGPSGARTGDAMGAKPRVRQLMGTAVEDGIYPAFTVEQLCDLTKKSSVNIRTILSDLRSPKYCGAGGVFMTHSVKINGATHYRFGEAPAPAAASTSPEQPKAADTAPASETAAA